MLNKCFIQSPQEFMYSNDILSPATVEEKVVLRSSLTHLLTHQPLCKPFNFHAQRATDDEIFSAIPNFYSRIRKLSCDADFGMDNLHKILLNSPHLETLRTEIHLDPDGGGAAFRVRNAAGAVVVDRGRAGFD